MDRYDGYWFLFLFILFFGFGVPGLIFFPSWWLLLILLIPSGGGGGWYYYRRRTWRRVRVTDGVEGFYNL